MKQVAQVMLTPQTHTTVTHNDNYKVPCVFCTVINECESQPCQHGALCDDLPKGYQCLCPPGYTGPDCDVNIDDCNHDLCLNNATCVDLVASYHCDCGAGFEGEHCQIDIDECESSKSCPSSNVSLDLDSDNMDILN